MNKEASYILIYLGIFVRQLRKSATFSPKKKPKNQKPKTI